MFVLKYILNFPNNFALYLTIWFTKCLYPLSIKKLFTKV